jgi:GGDEF domain-containing protein
MIGQRSAITERGRSVVPPRGGRGQWNRALSFALFDIDDFKTVNDTTAIYMATGANDALHSQSISETPITGNTR